MEPVNTKGKAYIVKSRYITDFDKVCHGRYMKIKMQIFFGGWHTNRMENVTKSPWKLYLCHTGIALPYHSAILFLNIK